jgi:peptidoglycan/LPS O-acetylase OafA/YrhL
VVTLLAATVITTLPPGEFLTTSTTWSYLAHNATLFDLRDHLAEVFTSNPQRDVNISLWTLPLEFLMYMVVAVVGVVGLLRRRRLFNLAVIAAFAGYVLADGKLPVIDDRHGSELLMYFVAGAAFYANRDLLTLRGVPAMALLAAAMALSLVDEPWVHPAIILAFAYFVLWFGFTRRIRLPNLAARGDLSYATYLYAAFVTQAWIWAFGPFDPWLLTLATVAVTRPLAWLSWHLVESPALRAKPRVAGRLSRRRHKAAAPARV